MFRVCLRLARTPFFQNRTLKSLLENLRHFPENASKHSEYLKHLTENHQYYQAIQHFEGLPPHLKGDPQMAREYFRALLESGDPRTSDFHGFLRQFLGDSRSTPAAAMAAAPMYGPPMGNYAQPPPDSTSEPLKVCLVTSWRQILAQYFMRLGFFLVVFMGIQRVGEAFIDGFGGLLEQAQQIGSAKASVEPVEDISIRLSDVKGCQEVKAEVQEIISYLKDPDKFMRLGARLPKGMMLAGPPGCGKTLLARAMAGEAGVPFFSVAGSDFEDSLIGVGARRIRDLFKDAKQKAPCIIFIDEIDAIAGKRDTGDRMSSSAHRQALNQLLVEMDGFEQTEGIVLVCATNTPESLDSALTRPGRLDKTVHMTFPDLNGRREILELYASKVVMGTSVCLEALAKLSSGLCGADLFNIINIAAVRASANDQDHITQADLENAFDRVSVGLERESLMSDSEKEMTAFHEAGHALVLLASPDSDRIVHKVTILPRGSALGITWNIPETDKLSTSYKEYVCRLDMMMGGKAAEELIYGPENVTSGCSSDLQSATGLARRMVMNYGMSKDKSNVYLDARGYSMLSEAVRSRVDAEVEHLIQASYQRALTLLKREEKGLRQLADALLEFETLSRDECGLVMANQLEELREARKPTVTTPE